MKAKISEIFESIQGEGIYLGAPQVFVRFFGCNMACGYCDTRPTDFREVASLELLNEVRRFSDFHSVALTGGEPLLQADFLREFLPRLKAYSMRTYLETNGTLPEALSEVLPWVDIVAMDIKLPSSTGERPFWGEHEAFLRTAASKDIFVKMVVTPLTSIEDVNMARMVIERAKADAPVVLQPDGENSSAALVDRTVFFKQALLKAGLKDVRVLPQAHKLSGIR
jgi:7-carboxy-7-deazaguanine synthase